MGVCCIDYQHPRRYTLQHFCCTEHVAHFWLLGGQDFGCYNRVAKRSQHVMRDNIAICWVGMLPAFEGDS